MITELTFQSLDLQQEQVLAPQWEACAPQLESNPGLLKLEKACEQQWSPSAAKQK